MDAIVFLIESQELRQDLEDCLRPRYKVIAARGKRALRETFDLAILDGATLKRLHQGDSRAPYNRADAVLALSAGDDIRRARFDRRPPQTDDR